jgi:hypothetical protein
VLQSSRFELVILKTANAIGLAISVADGVAATATRMQNLSLWQRRRLGFDGKLSDAMIDRPFSEHAELPTGLGGGKPTKAAPKSD